MVLAGVESGPAILFHQFSAAAIVREEEDQGVIQLSLRLQRLHHLADAAVHLFDHRGVGRHAIGFPVFVGHACEGRRVGVAGGDVPWLAEEAFAVQLLMTRGADRVPALVVNTVIAGDVIRAGMKRPVWGGVGEVEEKWVLRSLDHVAGGVGDCVGEVEIV